MGNDKREVPGHPGTVQTREGWPVGFAGHEVEQRARLARLPFSEKLRWLEETQKLIGHLGGQGDKKDGPGV